MMIVTSGRHFGTLSRRAPSSANFPGLTRHHAPVPHAPRTRPRGDHHPLPGLTVPSYQARGSPDRCDCVLLRSLQRRVQPGGPGGQRWLRGARRSFRCTVLSVPSRKRGSRSAARVPRHWSVQSVGIRGTRMCRVIPSSRTSRSRFRPRSFEVVGIVSRLLFERPNCR